MCFKVQTIQDDQVSIIYTICLRCEVAPAPTTELAATMLGAATMAPDAAATAMIFLTQAHEQDLCPAV